MSRSDADRAAEPRASYRSRTRRHGSGCDNRLQAKVLRHSQGVAEREQDIVRLIADSNPVLPNRNAAITRTAPSLAPALADMTGGLTAAGADLLVMPCAAAHAFADAVIAATGCPSYI